MKYVLIILLLPTSLFAQIIHVPTDRADMRIKFPGCQITAGEKEREIKDLLDKFIKATPDSKLPELFSPASRNGIETILGDVSHSRAYFNALANTSEMSPLIVVRNKDSIVAVVAVRLKSGRLYYQISSFTKDSGKILFLYKQTAIDTSEGLLVDFLNKFPDSASRMEIANE